jgi:hypothetical protein
MPFPNQVNYTEAPAVAGDFCAANPWFSAPSGQGAFTSGSALYVGRFAWSDPTGSILNSTGSGPVTGFVHRNQQGIITTFLNEYTMQILPGIECSAMSGGDFWMVNNGTLVTTIGMKAYANYATGLVAFAPTGNPPAAGSVTGAIAPVSAISVTGSIAPGSAVIGTSAPTGVLTVTAVGSGTVVPGGILSGTGVQANTQIIAQLTGTTGGIGTYSVNIPQTVASTTITEAVGVLTVSAVASGAVGVGDALTGANVTAGTVVVGLGTGTGGTGTYYVTPSQTAASATITAAGYIETKWVCMDTGRAVGELVRASSQPLG